MSDSKATLRFDHREIAVIFSLFIFVSLLMFTVGILVGKGLAQARYEGVLLRLPPSPSLDSGADAASEKPAVNPPPSSGTSVSTDQPTLKTLAGEPPPATPATEGEAKAVASAAPASEPGKAEAKPEEKTAPLELVPKTSRTNNLAGTSLHEPVKSPETDALMKNPKLRSLVDNEAFTPEKENADRSNASAPPSATTKGSAEIAARQSLAAGPFTVQVGSYPTEKDAAERVEALKKLGFSHAYFSAKQWNDTKETWYRVWLGYYPDYESAKRSGRTLQERGEVTNYLVRKTDAAK